VTFNNNQWFRWLPAFILAVLLIIFYKTLDSFSQITQWIGDFLGTISPFLFGILIVYILYIPCERLERLYRKYAGSFIAKKARGLSVISVYLILLLAIVLIGTFAMPILIKNLIEFARSLPAYYKHIMEKFPGGAFLSNFDMSNLHRLLDPIRLEQLGKSIMVFTSGIFRVVIGLVISIYILIDRDNIAGFFNKLSYVTLHGKKRDQCMKYLHQINKVIFAFLLGKSIDSIINTAAVTTILLILDVKYAFLFGIICGIANFIPYMGSLMAVAFVSIMVLITGGPAKAITAMIILAIFQQIDGNFIEPKIMGKTLKINPLLIIFSVIAGGAYFGVVGMFLAVPIVTILKQILLEYIDSREALIKNNSAETDVLQEAEIPENQ